METLCIYAELFTELRVLLDKCQFISKKFPLIKEPTLNNHIFPFLPSFYFFLTKFLILIRIRTKRNLVSSWSYIKVVLITPITGLWTYKLKESYWNKQSAITQTKYKFCIDLFSQKGKVGVKVPILQLRHWLRHSQPLAYLGHRSTLWKGKLRIWIKAQLNNYHIWSKKRGILQHFQCFSTQGEW